MAAGTRQGSTTGKASAGEFKSVADALESLEAKDWRAPMAEKWKVLVGDMTSNRENPRKVPKGRPAICAKWTSKCKLKEDSSGTQHSAPSDPKVLAGGRGGVV